MSELAELQRTRYLSLYRIFIPVFDSGTPHKRMVPSNEEEAKNFLKKKKSWKEELIYKIKLDQSGNKMKVLVTNVKYKFD